MRRDNQLSGRPRVSETGYRTSRCTMTAGAVGGEVANEKQYRFTSSECVA